MGIISQYLRIAVNYIHSKNCFSMGLKQKIKSMIQDCSICNKLKSKNEETK